MLKRLQTYRYEAYLFTLGLVLFGNLIFPEKAFENWILTSCLMVNITAGFILISVRKKALLYYSIMLLGGVVFYVIWLIDHPGTTQYLNLARLGFYSVFYTIVTIELILQVWKIRQVNRKVILGLMSGYISLGLISFFLLYAIAIAEPSSFSGISDTLAVDYREKLMYFTYITLMTIGYGEIVPTTAIAHKAVVLIGLCGQFYLVIFSAVVVGKYISAQHLIK